MGETRQGASYEKTACVRAPSRSLHRRLFRGGLASQVISPAYYPDRLVPIEWTGLYFGVNAGYGWAKESSTIFFTGFTGGATTPAALGGSGISTSGQGVTELGGTDVVGSSSPSGGIAGGQLGFNWQSGMIVFGAEVDAQWSGQQATASVVCTPNSTASSTVKIKSLTTSYWPGLRLDTSLRDCRWRAGKR
jgi:opacity protein-like surface antigen